MSSSVLERISPPIGSVEGEALWPLGPAVGKDKFLAWGEFCGDSDDRKKGSWGDCKEGEIEKILLAALIWQGFFSTLPEAEAYPSISGLGNHKQVWETFCTFETNPKNVALDAV